MSFQKLLPRLTLVLALAFTTSAFAQNTKITESGETTVDLATSFLSALQSLGVTPGVIGPTQLNGVKVNFPITSGAIDLDTALGNIDHSGGLTLTAGSTVVSIQNFIIDTTGSAPVITGLASVNGALVGRIPLFDLTLPSNFSLPLKLTDSVLLNLCSVGVTLDATAAKTLNKVFGITALKGGLAIGTANVQAFTNGWENEK